MIGVRVNIILVRFLIESSLHRTLIMQKIDAAYETKMVAFELDCNDGKGSYSIRNRKMIFVDLSEWCNV